MYSRLVSDGLRISTKHQGVEREAPVVQSYVDEGVKVPKSWKSYYTPQIVRREAIRAFGDNQVDMACNRLL